MKRLLFTILAVILTATSCVEDFRNEISEIHEQIDELRTLISKANNNLEALQTIVSAIQNNDSVITLVLTERLRGGLTTDSRYISHERTRIMIQNLVFTRPISELVYDRDFATVIGVIDANFISRQRSHRITPAYGVTARSIDSGTSALS
jgi:hypothetical protein